MSLVSLGMSRTIKQPAHSGLCLAACAATLLGHNKSAFNAWSLSGYIRKMPEGVCLHLSDRRYMSMADLTIVLALQGVRIGSWWNSGSDTEVRFEHVEKYDVTHHLEESPALVIVHTQGRSPAYTHAVVYDNESQGVRDPSWAVSEELVPLSNYRVAEWYPVDKFQEDER